jgi:hypothetical protein
LRESLVAGRTQQFTAEIAKIPWHAQAYAPSLVLAGRRHVNVSAIASNRLRSPIVSTDIHATAEYAISVVNAAAMRMGIDGLGRANNSKGAPSRAAALAIPILSRGDGLMET